MKHLEQGGVGSFSVVNLLHFHACTYTIHLYHLTAKAKTSTNILLWKNSDLALKFVFSVYFAHTHTHTHTHTHIDKK